MRPDVTEWFTRRTTAAADWPLRRLMALKAETSTTVAVVLPARNEAATVGRIVESVRRVLVERTRLVDELLVVDSASTDATASLAADAGAQLVRLDVPGKGRALQAGVAATTADIVCFIDADLTDFTSSFVTGLVGPLLADPQLHLVKATYDRPGPDGAPAGGGRVTELVARPLINAHWPQLVGFVQPLGGEYAARRGLLESLPFPVGYGVELAILIDSLSAVGLDGLAQVDLARRKHRHQGNVKLGQMAAAIVRVAERRLGVAQPALAELVQWERSGSGYRPVLTDVSEPELPALASLR
ncbi:MAG: glucosyl-3-phosphoglycerate synthase [Frankiales bacterium]|nr:glucosyl-3-phosphoglycerate synthase [Frankiales bacterium]